MGLFGLIGKLAFHPSRLDTHVRYSGSVDDSSSRRIYCRGRARNRVSFRTLILNAVLLHAMIPWAYKPRAELTPERLTTWHCARNGGRSIRASRYEDPCHTAAKTGQMHIDTWLATRGRRIQIQGNTSACRNRRPARRDPYPLAHCLSPDALSPCISPSRWFCLMSYP